MKTRKIIYADEGKILTDGTHYGKQVFLAYGVDESAFHEITEEEYQAFMEKRSECRNT